MRDLILFFVSFLNFFMVLGGSVDVLGFEFELIDVFLVFSWVWILIIFWIKKDFEVFMFLFEIMEEFKEFIEDDVKFFIWCLFLKFCFLDLILFKLFF